MSKASSRGRRSHYSGPLAEPIPWEPPLPVLADTPPAGCSPRTAEIHKAMMAEIEEHNACRARGLWTAEWRKLMLLCEHFGISIDPLPPGWSRDLALCLARRHESLFTKGSKRKYSEIFAAYGIDPDQQEGDADLALALALAHKHVPGMSYSAPEAAQSRLTTHQLASLAIASTAVRKHLREAGEQESDRQVAAILFTPDRLASIIPMPAANGIALMIENSGNDDQTNPSPLSDTALRVYLRQMREALTAVRAGHGTKLQVQFVEEVLPLLHGLSRQGDEEAGQI